MQPIRARSDLWAGIFLVVALILISISIWLLGSERQIFARQELYHVSFQDIKGLNPGAPVRLGGIAIGRVAKIGFSPNLTDPKVYVSLLINEEYLERLREDSEAGIETQGLLGDKFVNVSPGAKIKQLLPGSTIKTRESGDFGAVLSKAEVVVQNTMEISTQFKKLVEELRTKSLTDITDAFRHIADLSKEIKDGDGLLHRLIYSKKDGQDILDNLTAASKSIKDVTEELKGGDGVLSALIYGEGGRDTVAALKNSAEKIGLASDGLHEMLESIKNGSGAAHTLIYGKDKSNLSEVIAKLHEAAENLRVASQAMAQGSGTLGALLIDSKVYDNLVEVTDEAKRSYILRSAIRGALEKEEEQGQSSGERSKE